MVAVAAADVAKNFGQWHDKALNEPVIVTKYGRESVVVLSVDTFKQLISHYREVVDTSEMDEIVADSIERSDIPEEYRWEVDRRGCSELPSGNLTSDDGGSQ